MAAYGSTPITDPDQLGFELAATDIATNFAAAAEEILIDVTNRRIALKVIGNLTEDGATIKAVYSKLKDAWRANAELIKFPFPMGPITDEQFELINGWNWDATQTSGTSLANTQQLLRTGGWQVLDATGATTEQWAGVITLGTLVDNTDQVYYQQVNADTAPVDIVLTNAVNQAVQILSDPNGDGNFVDGFDNRNYFKLFVREWGKTYAQSEIADIGVSQMTFQAYRFPLTNATDLNITEAVEANVNLGNYLLVDINYLRDANNAVYTVLGAYNPSSFVYVVGNVVQAADGRWYKCILGYTSDATEPSANVTNWASYEGERQIGALWYAFTVIIDADNTVGPTLSGINRTTAIYERIQYELRLATDIDDGVDVAADVRGDTADPLLSFVGSTLVTAPGVYVDSFNTQDTNSLEFFDSTGIARTFPFVAALTVNFGTNLQADQFAKFWVFFTNCDGFENAGSDFGTANAIIVQDNDSVPMADDVNPAWPTRRTSVSLSYNYDGNIQRGASSIATNAPITVVGIGLESGQYVTATGLIEKNTANSVSLVSALERNYDAGTVPAV